MAHKKHTERVFLLLSFLVLVFSALHTYFLFDTLKPVDSVEKVKSMLISGASSFYLVAGFGLAGLFFAKKAGFADLYGDSVSWRLRYLYPVLAGCGLAYLFIVADLALNPQTPLINIWQPQAHISFLVGYSTSMLEEVLFRLFLLPILFWFLYKVVLKKSFYKASFIIASLLSIAAFTFLHVPDFIGLSSLQVQALPQQLIYEIMALNAVQSIIAVLLLYRAGFFSVVLLHYTMDIFWTVYFM